MSRSMMIRRLRGPAFLLLVGVNALLNQMDILSWGHSWPFYLILAGVLALAERAALAAEGYPHPMPYPQQPGAWQPGVQPPQAPASTTAAIVPAGAHEIEKSSEGGQQ